MMSFQEPWPAQAATSRADLCSQSNIELFGYTKNLDPYLGVTQAQLLQYQLKYFNIKNTIALIKGR